MNDSHLFNCAPCRDDWRLRRASARDSSGADPEGGEPVDEAFVRRVLAAIQKDRRRRNALAARLAAVAALLFFFFAGAAGEKAASQQTGAEQEYAQLDLGSELDGFLPD